MEMFTNSLTGAAFIKQNGKIRPTKSDKTGKVFFTSVGENPLYRSGYISDAAAAILKEKMEEDPDIKVSDVVSSFFDFAIINYVDDEGTPQECPTLMPKASGETLYSDDRL